MLFGAVGAPARERETLFRDLAKGMHGEVGWLGCEDASVLIRPWGVPALDTLDRWADDPTTGSWLAFSGHIRTYDDRGHAAETLMPAASLLSGLTEVGLRAIEPLEGALALVWFDGRSRQLHLVRDRFGMEPLYYGELPGGFIFGSRVRDLTDTGRLPGGFSPRGLAEYLTYCYVPSDATLDRDVYNVPPGHELVIDLATGARKCRAWYHLSFAGPRETSEERIADEFRRLLEQAVWRRLAPLRLGAFLSGGLDSSSVVTLARKHWDKAIQTYSYRCEGPSYDESKYARALAEAMATAHREVDYAESKALEIHSVVGEMDVPFCDTGLEVGTWLLCEAAHGQVDYVLTGDGGDEFWGSHPVYAGQKLIEPYDRLRVPKVLHRGLRGFLGLFPDSDRKRDLWVTLKRVLPSADLPRELGPSRWRVYYEAAGLGALLEPEVARVVSQEDPLKCVIDTYEGYDGPDDGLSPHLYSDYRTMAAGYFQRLRLSRHFGIEPRYPFYDHNLVEYGVRIPARLKLEGLERTKRLFRVAMEGVLPDIVNHRKDKLGHSIPLKNWLRNRSPVAETVADVLTSESIRRRGLFRPAAVSRLLDEHRERRHNHAHRLWALFVLEKWLRAREGRASPDDGRALTRS